jgi:hypothetical protein
MYEVISKSFRTGLLERELQMVQLSATRCFIAILWISLASSAAIILCVASQRVFIVVSVYFFIDSVRKLLDTLSYTCGQYTYHCYKIQCSGMTTGLSVYSLQDSRTHCIWLISLCFIYSFLVSLKTCFSAPRVRLTTLSHLWSSFLFSFFIFLIDSVMYVSHLWEMWFLSQFTS